MKYAIVTGASPSSIGFVAAKKLASPEFGYKVVLACRSNDKGQQAEHLIRSAYPSSEAVYVHLDLSSFDSIRKFVGDVRALDDGAITDKDKAGSLNLLVNNAGIGFGSSTPFVKTPHGLEEIVGVNHFGTFLLTQLLLEDLKQADGGSRVVIVASSLHAFNEMMSKKDKTETEDDDPIKKKQVLPDFPKDILQSEEDYNGFKAYQVSKLGNLWYAYELQRRLDGEAEASTGGGKSPVRVNALCPGFIPTTGLTRRTGILGIFFLRYVLDPLRHIGIGITRSPEDGGEAIVQTGTSEVASEGGQYFRLPKGETVITPIASSEESMDETKAKELWKLSLKTCKLEA